ncbi:hypothetical protein AC249_AIPGENE3725 [Exaiptasia diaphana]|nr:hypothetical protein AC249_AIPGENE3725 [Exaiptasia diaphana]
MMRVTITAVKTMRVTIPEVKTVRVTIPEVKTPSGLRLSVLEWFIMVFFIGRFMQEIDQFISERDEIHDLKTNYSKTFRFKMED